MAPSPLQMTYGEIVNEISPLSNNSAAHDVEFARRIVAARDAQWAAAQQRVPAEQAEPVAWRYRFHTDDSLAGKPNVRGWVLTDTRPPTRSGDIEVEPLFASPPAPQEAQPSARELEFALRSNTLGNQLRHLRRVAERAIDAAPASGWSDPNAPDALRSVLESLAAPVAQPATEQEEAPSDVRDGLPLLLVNSVEALSKEEDGGWTPDAHMQMRRIHTAVNGLRAQGLFATQPTASNAGERELLNQALDALSTYQGFIDDAHILEGQWHWLDDAKAADASIRAALASKPPQGEQKPGAWRKALEHAAAVLDSNTGPLTRAATAKGIRELLAAHPEPVAPPAREGWKEAAIAWTVCASIHEQWAKGKDALYKTRHADFERHAEEARSKALSHPSPQGSKG